MSDRVRVFDWRQDADSLEELRCTGLRVATQSLHRSDCFLGDYFRRMKARMGTPKAMTATAHKLARIVFHMITTQQPYDATIFQKQEERRRHQKSARLYAQARELGFQLIPINVVP